MAVSNDRLLEAARRTIAHVKADTVPLAETIAKVPAEHYLDHDRWLSELRSLFHRFPLVFGFSCEFVERFSYRSTEVMGVPVLVSRAADDTLRAFVNVCSHRGARVVAEGAGTTRRFTCPYHAWSYDNDGQLVGILDRDDFGDLDPSCNGLTPLPCAERAGIIFVGLEPNGEIDIDAHLCGYGDLLEFHGFADCTFVGSQSVDGPNWKVAYDGYLDFYHLPILHKDTFGPDRSNKAIYDAWGPHQRVSSPDHRMMELEDMPEADWPEDVLTNGVWTIFPHTSIAGFPVRVDGVEGGGRMYMVSTLFPGADPDSSVTIQNFLATFDPTDELMPEIAAQQEFLMYVVREEDYFTGNRIQRTVKTGAKTEFLFGRNEAGGQRFHGWVDRLVAAESADDYRAVFAQAEVVFQR